MMKQVKHKEYYVAEPPFPDTPIRSGILLGSSGQGNSHLMLSLLMGPYKNLHTRVVIVSPSAHVDPLWQVWKDFVRDQYPGWAEEETTFDSYDPDKLREIIDAHKLINQAVKHRHKGRGKCKLFSLCIFFDDMSDDNRFHDSHGSIAEIVLRRRHNYVQAICSSQQWRSLSTAVRGQACWLCMWSMRSADERKSAISELAGMYIQKQIEAFHEEATKERFNSVYVNLLAPHTRRCFVQEL